MEKIVKQVNWSLVTEAVRIVICLAMSRYFDWWKKDEGGGPGSTLHVIPVVWILLATSAKRTNAVDNNSIHQLLFAEAPVKDPVEISAVRRRFESQLPIHPSGNIFLAVFLRRVKYTLIHPKSSKLIVDVIFILKISSTIS